MLNLKQGETPTCADEFCGYYLEYFREMDFDRDGELYWYAIASNSRSGDLQVFQNEDLGESLRAARAQILDWVFEYSRSFEESNFY